MAGGHTIGRRYGTLAIQGELSVSALVENLAHPRRPSLAAARAALEGCSSAQEAWERAIARELLPATWVGDGARGFGDAQGATGAVPPTCEAVVALVADLSAVLTVEALLAECAARMAPWGAEPLWRVTWLFPRTLVNRTAPALRLLYDAVFDTWPASVQIKRNVDLRTPFRRARDKPRSLDGLVSALDRCGRAYGRWEGAAQTMQPFTSSRWQPGVAPNPFAPLLAVWQEGYIPLALRDGVAEVLVPPLAENGTEEY